MKKNFFLLLRTTMLFLLISTTFSLKATVLLYEDASGSTAYEDALIALGKTVVIATSETDFETKIDDGTSWELIVFSDYSNSLTSTLCTKLNTYVVNGGRVIFAHWDVSSQSTNALFTTMGVQFVSSFETPYSITPTSTSHALFTNPNVVNTFIPNENQFNTDGQLVTATSGITVATFSTLANSAIVINTTGRTIFNAFQACNYGNNIDGDAKEDIQELIENEITYLSIPQVPGVPVANFGSATVTTVGVPVTFYNQSTGVPTSWSWSFPGGTPSTSTLQNPVVTYAAAGTYNVTLTVSNTYGTDSEVKTSYITVTNSYNMTQTGTNSITSCGTIIYDNGGASASYSNSCSSTLTINPATAGNAVRLTFNSFYTESSYDYLYVYDGQSTTATLLGTYNGSSIPPVLTASNATGALTIRFTSDGSDTYSGFAITTSCVALPNYTIQSASWTSSVDNDGDLYSQSRILNYTVRNITATPVNLYTKTYYKPTTSSTYTLLYTTSNFAVAASSTSSAQTYSIFDLAMDSYDFKIELYNSSNVLVDTYDLSDDTDLSSQEFELASTDLYCLTNLNSGGTFDITNVNLIGTTLSNTAVRPTTVTSGSYINVFAATGTNTGTVLKGNTYTLSVTTSASDIVSVWIDYDQDGLLESTEWTQVVTSSIAGVASTVSITIPTSATVGQTRMRIRSRTSGNTNGSTNPCSIFTSGCTEDYTITIANPVPAIPVANFVASVTNTNIGATINFSDISTGEPTSWSWSFPGGTPSTSTARNPVVTYATSGTYNVTLTVTNSYGTDSETKTSYITITNSYLMTSGTSSITTCGTTIYDNGGSTGSYTNSISSTITINPATVGNAVRLTFNSFYTQSSSDYFYVYDGQSTSATLLGTYSGSTIPAAITASNATGALTIRFTSNTSTVYSGFEISTSCVPLPDYAIASASWTSSVDNDGDLYYQSRILNYTVRNISTSPANLYTKIYYKPTTSATYTLLITTSNFAVAASSTSSAQTYSVFNLALNSYDFKIELYNSSNVLVDTYDLSDDTDLTSQEFELASSDNYCSGNLNSSGTFDITSVIINGTTLSNTAVRPTTVTSGSYINVFAATGTNTGTVLKGSSYILSVTTSVSDIVSVWIDFDQDGIYESTEWTQVVTTSSAGVASTVIISIPTSATVGQTRMRIRSRAYGNTNGSTNACTTFSSGCTEDYTITIANPTPAVPVANFAASSITPNLGSSVTFTDLSTGVPTSWSWSFPGGTPSTSTTQNPVVTYSSSGTYTVTLTATNGLGSDVETKTAYITVLNTYIMTTSGTNSITTCGNTIYDNGGASSNYLSSTTTSTLTINPATAGNAVRLTFSSFSTESGLDILSVYDGQSTSATLIGSYSGSSIPAAITASNATGALTLRFSTDNSVSSSGFAITSSCISVTPTVPVANFSASTTTAMTGSSVTFTDLTSGIPSSWSWSFPGGTPSTSTAQNPVVTYATAGTYAVTLTATNGLGSDAETKTAYITVSNTYNMTTSGTNSITTCGNTIYDNGGVSGSYSSSTTTSTLTINPATVGSAIRLTFSSFNTESGLDILSVYDGQSTSATLIGSYSGSSIPAAITASNATGALTLRFSTDNSVAYSGYAITTSCVALPNYTIQSASWTSIVDNDGDSYSQSRILNYTVRNITASAANLYAKIYYKPSTSATYTLLTTTSNFAVAASSTSSAQTYSVSNLATNSYDFKIELYNSSNVLVDTYDLSDDTDLTSQEFELATSDLYCSGNLNSGGTFDITSVVISGTTLSNTAVRPTIVTGGSYLNVYAATGTNTGTILKGNTYTLNVTTSVSDIISVWIDYDQDGVFESTEWTQVTTMSTSGVASTVSITIPTSATVGQTRMRIRSRASGNTNGSINACTSFSSGCTEDYTITIANPNPTVPVANFTVSNTAISVGTAISFTDLSTGVPTSWSWSFPGGTPSTSTLQNPVVTYSNVGTYNAVLTVTNSLGADTETKTAYITVTNSYNMTATGTNTITGCGITIYDNGGSTGNYDNFANSTLTLNPATSGTVMRLSFNSFNTESSLDEIDVYDGQSTSANLIGSYSGSSIPATITATNASGALTLRFSTDGSVTYSGFEILASCVEITDYAVQTVSWTGIVDNDVDSYAQSGILNYTVQNITATTANIYTKIYYKTSSSTNYSLFYRSSEFPVVGNSTSSYQTLFIDGLISNSYDFMIDIYNSNDELIARYSKSDNLQMGSREFEYAEFDTYCVSSLDGGDFDITQVTLVGTTLNNSDVRPMLLTAGSYYTAFTETPNTTCTIEKGELYQLSVTTSNNDIIAVWIDYNQNGVFETSEYTSVTNASNSNSVIAAINIPNTALNGRTVMRIRTATNGNTMAGGDACTTYYSGCTEDYIVTIGVTTPSITFNGSVLRSSASSGNQWYNQAGLITGATGQYYSPTANGEYYVIVSNSNGSSDPSNTVNVVALDINEIETTEITLFPIPVKDKLTISNEGSSEIINYEIVNAKGQVIENGSFINTQEVNMSILPSGVYIIKIQKNNSIEYKKFIKK